MIGEQKQQSRYYGLEGEKRSKKTCGLKKGVWMEGNGEVLLAGLIHKKVLKGRREGEWKRSEDEGMEG